MTAAKWLRTGEAAKATGLPAEVIRDLCDTDVLRTFRHHNRRYIDPADVAELVRMMREPESVQRAWKEAQRARSGAADIDRVDGAE